MIEEYRHVPYDIECEQALLGSLLVNNSFIDEAAASLREEDFYEALHQRIFQILCVLAAQGEVTPLILHAEMKADPGLVEVGGHGYLAGLALSAPAMPNVKAFVRILKELSARRALIRIGEDVVNAAYEAPHEFSSAKIASESVEAILNLRADAPNRTRSAGDIMLGALERAERWLKHGNERPRGISTGLGKLDRALGGGLMPGDRAVIAARSGMGKSAIANVIGRASAQDGNPTLIISADMSAEQWSNRTLCEYHHLIYNGVAPIPSWKLRSGNLTNIEIEQLLEAQREIATWPLTVCDEGDIDVPTIRMRARAMAKKYPKKQGRLVVDFVQKLKDPRRGRDVRRDQEITDIIYALGDIVKDIGWDLVGLAQMKNKDVDANGKLRESPPTVADIRESGGIEQAVDILFTIFRKAWFIEQRPPEYKNADGTVSQSWINWRAELSEVENSCRTVGYKNRDGAISKLSLDLWCSMEVSAIRDEAPSYATSQTPAQPSLNLDTLAADMAG
jgi:replicative DNA helicase